MIEVIEVIEVDKRDGYELRQVRVSGDEAGGGPSFMIVQALTPAGDYIGDAKMASYLVDELGVAPEKAEPTHCVCSIGFSTKSQKWYGWSHRALYGYGIGYVAKAGDLPTTWGVVEDYQVPGNEFDKRVPVGFEVKTLDDARRCAVAHAEAVS